MAQAKDPSMQGSRNCFQFRVYVEDTDAGGVVYYANYLKFMERARTEFIRQLGINKARMNELNVVFVVRQVLIQYLAPAYLDDELLVQADPMQRSRCAMTFAQDILRVGDACLLCKAQVQVVCVNKRTMRPCPLPASIPAP